MSKTYRPDPLGPLCPGCMRPEHQGFECSELGIAELEGAGLAEAGAPLCHTCLRHHWPVEKCPLRSPEEVDAYRRRRSLVGR